MRNTVTAIAVIVVTGHTDSVPIRTIQFPSNWHLSLARAQAVVDMMSEFVADPDRLAAEGRADNEPIADNSTREGQARNRRIEVLLIDG